jgi:hypothetical protein
MNLTANFPATAGKRIRRFRFGLPAVLLWLLLLPFAPVLLLAVLIVCAVGAVNPFRAVAALFRVVAALKGTRVEVQSGQVSILLSLF